MTDAHLSPPPAADEPLTRDQEVAVVQAELGRVEGGDRLVRYGRRVRAAGWLLAAVVAGTGLLALALSLAVWRDDGAVLVLAVLVCLPAIVAPIYVARRAGALAVAASQPRELVAQARDLVTRVRDSVELQTLARRLLRRSAAAGGGPAATRRSTGKLRSTFRMARLVSTVVGQAQPDPVRHSLLVPFTPERLRHTWWGVIASLWAWLVAALVVVVALADLAI